jgi:2,5-diketo-D-gluconate reductase B
MRRGARRCGDGVLADCGRTRLRRPVLRRVAGDHGVDPAAVSLAWLLQKGAIVIPASSRREHLEANWRAADLRLSTDEMTVIEALDRGQRLVDPEKSPAWD